jgi:glycerol-3-phosphate dehydrogenase (NAD(P)+)
MERKGGDTCLISPHQGTGGGSDHKELMTPSQMINNSLYRLKYKYDIVCIGGPFFVLDIALGNPVCVTVAGKKRNAMLVRSGSSSSTGGNCLLL